MVWYGMYFVLGIFIYTCYTDSKTFHVQTVHAQCVPQFLEWTPDPSAISSRSCHDFPWHQIPANSRKKLSLHSFSSHSSSLKLKYNQLICGVQFCDGDVCFSAWQDTGLCSRSGRRRVVPCSTVRKFHTVFVPLKAPMKCCPREVMTGCT